MFVDPNQTVVMSPLTEYLLNHLQVLGWPALLWMAAKVCFRIGRFFTLLEARILSRETQLVRVTEEDIPAIKDGIDEINTNVLSLVAARSSNL